MIRFYLLLLIFIPLSSVLSFANEGTISSYEGRHFLVGFIDNEINVYSPPYQSIYLSSKYNTEVTITEPRLGKTYTLKLKKDSIIHIDVDEDYEHIDPEVIFGNKLIEISSKAPISCVAKSSLLQSGDKFSIIPTRNWGTEHYAVTMPNDYYIEPIDQDPQIVELQKTSRLGEFLILANENFTNVEITVAADTYKGAAKDSTIKIRLNKGQSYLVKSKYSHGINGVHDLSGSRIVSDKPVGVVSGHMRTSIQQQTSYSSLTSKDHIVEMLPPTNTWGKEYITVPFGNGIRSMFKVIAKDTIDLRLANDDNINNIYLLPGEVHTFDNIEMPTHWSANGKFLITQFMAKYVETFDSFKYDPSMVVIPALDKMINKTTYFGSNDVFVYNDKFITQYDNQAVIIIADEKGKSSIKVNNRNVNEILGFNTFSLAGEPYYWQKVFVPPNPSINTIVADSGGFHAIAIANGVYDSYAMTVGASLIDEEQSDFSEPILDFVESCSTIRGTILDEKVSSFSGINVIEVDEVETYNFSWSHTPITDTTTFVKLDGNIIDKNKPANFKFTVIDYFGNSSTYEYYRPGAQVVLIDKLDYKEVNIKKDSCIIFDLRTEADSVLLESVDLPADMRLKLNLPFALPKMLYKEQTYRLILCLNNQANNQNAVIDSMFFNFDCEYSRKVDINAIVINFDLSASNLKLPKILSGTSYTTDAMEFVEFTNTGNAVITCDSVILPPSIYFTIDTVGMFPYKLSQGESIKFNKINFTQTVKGNHDYTITLMDNHKINRTATITGSIGEPKINNLFFDFGNTRIGTSKNTIQSFKNTGDFISQFSFISVVSSLQNDPNVTTLEGLSLVILDENQSEDISLVYNPTEVNDFTKYSLTAKFVERWTPHDTILVNLTGQPTLPQINTYDIDLDTIKIFTFKDSTVDVIISYGNEDLKINRIYKLIGDENVFEYDKSFYNTRVIGQGVTEQLPIRFNGLTLGEQTMTLIVESDAAPNYGVKTDTIRIRGFVAEQDTLDISIYPEDITVQSCNFDTLEIEIQNTGNTNFQLQNIDIVSDIQVATLIDNNFGDTLSPSQSIKKQLIVMSSGNKSDKIYYNISVFDLVQRKDSIFVTESVVNSVQSRITINPLEAGELQIGKYFDVRFSGRFPNYIDTTADIYVTIDIDTYNFFLDNNETIVYFYDSENNKKKELKATISKEADRLTLISDEFSDFNFENIISWEFDLRFLALLHTDLEGEMGINFDLSDCYDGNAILNTLNVDQICVYNYRNIVLSSYIEGVSIAPNVISDEANLTVDVSDELTGSVYIIDYVGKKYNVLDKILFDKGKNNIILNLSKYANGKYILVVRSLGTTLTQEFIITK
jgi:hypothetical protein